MEKTYNFSGTCSRNVTFDIDENHVVTNIRFNGGCRALRGYEGGGHHQKN